MKEQWDKHLYSIRHLHKEPYGYTPAYFPNKKMAGDESSILEKAFWKKIFATRGFKEVDAFLITYFMMVTNLMYYFKDSVDFRKEFRVMLAGQFECDLYKKCFSRQLESDDDEFTLQQRIKWWITVCDRGGPIPSNVFDYIFVELFDLYRKAIDPGLQNFVKELRDRHIIP